MKEGLSGQEYNKERVLEQLEELHESLSCDDWFTATKVYEVIEITQNEEDRNTILQRLEKLYESLLYDDSFTKMKVEKAVEIVRNGGINE